MVLDAFGEVLPAAIGVALSPIPIIAIVLVLATPRAAVNGWSFATGWVTGLAGSTAVVMVILGGPTEDEGAGGSTTIAWVRIVLGTALLLYAVKKWRGRPRRSEETPMPGWMSSLDRLEPLKAIGLGVALSGLNPKNLAFTLSAVGSIAEVGLDGGEAAGAAAIYVALGSATVLGAVVAHAVAPERSAGALASVKQFMVANSTALMVAILVLLGAMILGDGLAGL